MQKRIVASDPTPEAPAPEFPWIDLEDNATLQLSSEDPAHPIEAALTGDNEIGWVAAEPGPQYIRFTFYAPRAIHRVYLCIDADEHRTQEFVLRWSADGGVTYRDVVRQQFNFSASTHREEETYQVELRGATDLKLEITPNVSGGTAVATMRAFRIG
jgi:hypothetical protein